MNLIVVTPSFPRPTWGAGTRNYYLLKALAREHTVSLLSLADRVEVDACDASFFEDSVRHVRVVARPESHSKRVRQLADVVRRKSYILTMHDVAEMQDALDALLAQHRYDAVLFESVLVAGYGLPGGVKIVIDQHNIEHELLQRTAEGRGGRLRRWYNQQESRLLQPVEIERCRRANAVLVTSERERIVLKGMLPETIIEVVPNGVDPEVFHESCSERSVPDRVVFTGTMKYYPNVEAVLFFAKKCWPLIRTQVPEATWQIVGDGPPPEVQRLVELPGVSVTGFVPDIRSYLGSAAVAIAPLLVGGGTRLKILEALAMRKAVVSTSLGCEGLSVVSGKHLLVANQPEAFARAVVTLLRDPGQRDALGGAGRVLVEKEYSWEHSGTQLLRVLDKI